MSTIGLNMKTDADLSDNGGLDAATLGCKDMF